jgi:DNA-binding LytR/AlgR family response regulator
MSEPVRIAVLDDDRAIFLKALVDSLKKMEEVRLIHFDHDPESFVSKVQQSNVEMVLLDIQLKSSVSGIQVAEVLKLPVLFISGERKDFLVEIDNLKLSEDFPVENIGKIFNPEKLRTIFTKFIPRVREYQKTRTVKIKPIGEDYLSINPLDVVFIESVKGTGNHRLCFHDKVPVIVADKNFDFFINNGFPEDKFYRYSRDVLFNINRTQFIDGKLNASYFNTQRKAEVFEISVSAEKRAEVKRRLPK